jgi:hypothetical protein
VKFKGFGSSRGRKEGRDGTPTGEAGPGGSSLVDSSPRGVPAIPVEPGTPYWFPRPDDLRDAKARLDREVELQNERLRGG